VVEGTGDPEGTFTPIDPVTAVPGLQEAEAGLESVSATMFDSPVMWRITGANSATKERWRCWRAEIGLDRLCRTPTRSLICEDDKTAALQHVTEVADGCHYRQKLAVEGAVADLGLVQLC
jgi:hypothetical protein